MGPVLRGSDPAVLPQEWGVPGPPEVPLLLLLLSGSALAPYCPASDFGTLLNQSLLSLFPEKAPCFFISGNILSFLDLM